MRANSWQYMVVPIGVEFNIRYNYVVEDIATDEILQPFRCGSSSRLYMKFKPAQKSGYVVRSFSFLFMLVVYTISLSHELYKYHNMLAIVYFLFVNLEYYEF